MLEHEYIFNTWTALHHRTWSKFEANPQNKITLIAAASKYRPCFVAFDRAMEDSQAQLIRSDGKTAEDDRVEEAQRRAAKDAALDASIVVDPAFQEYIMGLSQAQIADAYYSEPTSEFARKYRICVRDLGYRLPSRPAETPRRAFVRGGVQE